MKRESEAETSAAAQPPGTLADLAFLDIRDVCAAARLSATWIHDEVRAGRFPQPLRFGSRCSRWRSADVRAWLQARAADASSEAAADLTARAKKASEAARAARQARKSGGVPS